MTRCRKISWLVVIGIITATLAVIAHDRFVAGPLCDGVPLNVWLSLLDRSEGKIPDKARQEIRQLGPAATPLVIEWLDWKDSMLRRALSAWVAGDPRHINYQPLNSADRRRLALEACDALGPAAEPAIPKLVAVSTGPNPELDAPFLIARIGGSNALPALARISASSNEYLSAGAKVSANLLRAQSPLLKLDPDAPSEQRDFARSLTKYRALVVLAVVSNKPPYPAGAASTR